MTHDYRFGYSTTREDGTTVHYDMTAEITDEHIEELIRKADQGDQEALDQAVKFICGCHLTSDYKKWLKYIADKNEQAASAVRTLEDPHERLASGWKIDLTSEEEKEEFRQYARENLPELTEDDIESLLTIHPNVLIWYYEKRMDDAHVYCRAINAVIENEDQICESCPLAVKNLDYCEYFRNQDFAPKGIDIHDLPQKINNAIAAGVETRFPQFLLYDRAPEQYKIVERALQYAADAHAGAFRKGTHLPYIIHPIEVAMIVQHSFSLDARNLRDDEIFVIAAAALHDVVEDTPHTIEDIRAAFGDRIAGLVASESEDKREGMRAEDSWKIRKKEFLEHLAGASTDSKLIALADKLSNLRALAKDYARQGDTLWQRFNQKDPKEHEWYYGSVLREVQELDGLQCYHEYEHLLDQVFCNGQMTYEKPKHAKTGSLRDLMKDMDITRQVLRYLFPNEKF